jgi:hypothetical protein
MWRTGGVSAAIAATRGRRLATPATRSAPSGGPGRWARGRQAEVAKDLLDHWPLLDEGDDLPTAAAGAGEGVFAEDGEEQFAPRNA